MPRTAREVLDQFGAPPAWVAKYPYNQAIVDGRDIVTLPLGEQLLPTLQLAGYARAMLPRLEGSVTPWEFLLMQLFLRGEQFCSASMRLLRAGYAAPACAPARGVFEIMLNTYWVVENRHDPAKISRHLADHERYWETELRNKFSRLPGWKDALPALEPFPSKTQEEKHRKRWQHGISGEAAHFRIKRWTHGEARMDPRIGQLARDASPDNHPFFPEDTPHELTRVYEVSIGEANLAIHGSRRHIEDSLIGVLTAEDDTRRPPRTIAITGPHPRLAMRGTALALAHWSMDRLMRVIFRLRGWDQDVLGALLAEHNRAQRLVGAWQLDACARNDLCPCEMRGPGDAVLKAKKCHGRAQRLPMGKIETALAQLEFAELPDWGSASG